jgi:hypothetical protein
MESSQNKTIVIIGDWFIDENWLVSRQKLYHSSQTGDVHYQLRHVKVDKRNISLCGAAELLEVLSSHFAKDKSYKFIGYGIWNPADNDVIQCTLCPDYTKEKLLTPFTLMSLRPIEKTNQRMCPYSKSSCHYNPDLRNLVSQEAIQVSTNRIIRCYEGFGGGKPHLLYRFDWTIPLPTEKELLNYDRLTELKNMRDSVFAVVIEDHGNDVINETSIECLLENVNKDTMWFVRTKMEDPPWIGVLKKYGIKLNLIVSDFKLANYKKQERRWWQDKELSRAALELLGEMTNDIIFDGIKPVEPDSLEAESAAILLDDNTVFAKEGDLCFSINQPQKEKQLINVGRTTMFYAGLVAQKLSRDASGGSSPDCFGNECSKALLCAYNWTKSSSDSWNKADLYFYGDYEKALEALTCGKNSIVNVQVNSYKKLWKMWVDASQKLGTIIDNTSQLGKREIFQVWRGESTLPNYICVGGPKRDAINRLVSSIAAFKREKEPKHPFSCLLISAPGWGKSFLARCLANYFDMEFLEFSIAQMSTSRDLVDCLATIASVQNRTQNRTLVFIDEVNAEIEGHSAMGLLLGPLWDGMFITNGKSYRLSPGTWVFASTDRITKLVLCGKGSDFISRLNGPIIELDSAGSQHLASAIKDVRDKLNTMVGVNLDRYEIEIYQLPAYTNFERDNDDVLKTEQIYLMVSLLSDHWGPISRIQKEVLKLFHDLLPVNGFRSLEFFSSNFANVTRGEIVASNVPNLETFEELRRHVILPKRWLRTMSRPSDPVSEDEFIWIQTIIR